jgi:hypothetical protein
MTGDEHHQADRREVGVDGVPTRPLDAPDPHAIQDRLRRPRFLRRAPATGTSLSLWRL